MALRRSSLQVYLWSLALPFSPPTVLRPPLARFVQDDAPADAELEGARERRTRTPSDPPSGFFQGRPGAA